jgi:restriction endonuclease S subunit
MQGVLGDKSAQPNASAKTMTQVKLKLPPLPEQRAIAHILGSLADYTEACGRGKAAIDQEEAARVMLEKFEIVVSMFHGFDYT